MERERKRKMKIEREVKKVAKFLKNMVRKLLFYTAKASFLFESPQSLPQAPHSHLI